MKNFFIIVTLLAGGAAWADMLQTRTGTYNGQVTHVEGNSVFIKLEHGEFAVPLRDLTRADVAAPADYKAGIQALKAGNAQEAARLLKPLVDRFLGLPVDWALDMLLRLGDAYLAQKDVAAAQKVFDSLKRLYPNSPQALAVDVKNAHILFAMKKYDDAIKAIKAYLDPQLKKDFLPSDQETAVAEALVLLGDCHLASNKPYEALDNYLRVVTLYDLDDARVGEAQLKLAGVLERTGNWKRAKESYAKLVKDLPDSPYAAEAKKQIDAISKAHPE
jgi:TolA-binding protein